MKVLVYSHREDEKTFFENFSQKYLLELNCTREELSRENAYLAKGCEAVNIAAAGSIEEDVIKILKENGVKYIVTRTAGVNHMDLEAIKKYGLKAANVPSYSPNAISEHTLMLALGLMRNMKSAIKRVEEQNFTLKGLRGKEIRNMTVGIVGTGRIGIETIKAFKSLGAKVLAYDVYPREAAKQYAAYVSLEALYQRSDIISFHCPFTPENYHLVNKESIHQMKDGVYLINTARGELFDYDAVKEALESGKIGALGFDVYEKEDSFMRKDLKGKELSDPVFNELMSMDNVIFTPHIAFYTDEAVSNMVEFSLENLYEYKTTGNSKNELII